MVLSALVLAYSLGNLQYILEDIHLISITDLYKYVYFPLATLIPALIYLYVDFFLDPSKNWSRRSYSLLLPFFVFLVVTLYFRVRFLRSSTSDSLFEFYRNFIMLVEVFSIGFALTLLAMGIRKVWLFKKKLQAYPKDKVRFSVDWLLYTLNLILLFTFVWAYLTYENLVITHGETSFYLLWVTIASLIYWLGHMGIYTFGIREERQKIRNYLHHSREDLFKKKGKSSLVQQVEDGLVKQKLFLDSNLTLEALASRMDISAGHLSRTIKQEMGTSFVDYVNTLRVEEAKKHLKNPDFASYTITAIGLEAGFNSKSTFYEVFKKNTGHTPAAFKKEKLS